MKVLVTGQDGQLSRCLQVRAPSYPGIDLTAVGRSSLDLERTESIMNIVRDIRPDVVIAAAAYTAVDQAEEEPEKAHRVNGEAAGILAAAARDCGARLIHISTDYVFDGAASAPYPVTAPTAPLGVYGASKLKGEVAVRDAYPEATIVRIAWVFSTFGKNFLKTMLGLGAEHAEVRVVADQKGNPSSAHDIADGLLTMIEAWRTGSNAGAGRTYHLASRDVVSWYDFASQIFEEAERNGLPAAAVRPIATKDWPTRAPRPPYSALDSSAFAEDFGFHMPDWRDATGRAIREIAALGMARACS